MAVVMTPPVPDDAEALFEEARQRTRRRRRRHAATVIALAAVGVLLAVALLVHDSGDRADDSAGTTRRPAANAGGDLLFMRVLPNDRLVRVDPRSGDARTLTILLACGDAPACLIASGRQLIIGDPGQTLAYSPSAADHRRPNPVGNGWITVPSQTPGTVWLGILAPHQDSYHRRLSVVREVDLADGRVRRSMRPPGGRWPVAAVNDGLLFQAGNHLRLWSFTTHRLTTRLPGAFPAGAAGSTVASCQDPCRAYTVTDLRTAGAQRITPPAGYRWTGGYEGELSPDAGRLALPITDTASHSRTDADALALVNLADRTVRVVPGSNAVEPIYRPMTWSTTGRRLFFTTRAGAVRAYTPGATRSTTVAQLPGDARAMQIVAVVRGD